MTEAFDPFGRDPAFIERLAPRFDVLLDRVFALELTGTENIPDSGHAILVANHGGALPWDAAVLTFAIQRALPGRIVRPLLEDAVMTAPFLGMWMNRLGAVRASQENAARLLERDELIAVFPEGLLGLSKLYRHRHKLVRFGRGGFVRLALSTGAPLIPVTILGAEDTAPLLTKWKFLMRGTAVDYLPVTPTFPALGPVGLLPLPARWAIHIGTPIDARAEIASVDDDVAIGDLAGRIRGRIEDDLSALKAARPSTYTIAERFKWRASR